MQPSKEKSEEQIVFEKLRHFFSSKHQVPSYLTLWELNYMLETLKNIPEESK